MGWRAALEPTEEPTKEPGNGKSEQTLSTNKLRTDFENGEFEPFIRSLRFPRFKNIEKDTRIDFTHPITALVGANGTNKTSILRVLEGCPDYQNFGNYWFTTNLDPINPETQHRFVHSYNTPSGRRVESRKTRVSKPGNPDYFEPARPSARDGMELMEDERSTANVDLDYRTKTRWKAISKKTLYLDFRHDIPAYDLHFHFNHRSGKNDTYNKKLLLRRQARHLSSALLNLEANHTLYGVNRVLQDPVVLDRKSIDWINRILDRKYTEIRIIKHDFYNFEGFTVLMKTAGYTYSEAFAGSGEYAAVMLVRSILGADEKSLILLDEPEVSLHPGAQRGLLAFLENQAAVGKHQIVISTHSPEMIKGLPTDAVKVLIRNNASDSVTISGQDCLPEEAFKRIGISTGQRVVYVEDELARRIVSAAIKPLGSAITDHIQLEIAGGSDHIKNRMIPLMERLNTPGLIYLDGDQRPAKWPFDVDGLADRDLEEHMTALNIRKGSLGLDGGTANNTDQWLAKSRQILKWTEKHLQFLPSQYCPEQLLLKVMGEKVPLTARDAKRVWIEKCAFSLGNANLDAITSVEILFTQRQALAKVPHNHGTLAEIRDCIRKFVEDNET